MNDLTLCAMFIAASALLFAPSLAARLMYSGIKFSKKIFMTMVFYNITCSAIHWRFIIDGKILFIGSFESFVMECSSLAFTLAYGYAIPYQKKQPQDKT